MFVSQVQKISTINKKKGKNESKYHHSPHHVRKPHLQIILERKKITQVILGALGTIFIFPKENKLTRIALRRWKENKFLYRTIRLEIKVK